MTKKSILIIGGSGHVSGAVRRAALALSYEVTIVTRGQKAIPEGVTSLIADRKDTAAMRAALPEGATWDLVVDCIGYEVEDARQDLELFAQRAKQFVFISTDFVFEPSQRRFPQPFDNPFFLQDESYGAKKRRCELEFLAYSDCGARACTAPSDGTDGRRGTSPRPTEETASGAAQTQWTVFRPCHIYGPPSQLGCLPEAARDPQLLHKMKAGEPVRLVGGGHFLQQPIHCDDLARLVLSVVDNPLAHGKTYCSVGPDIITSREYYEIIARVLGVPVQFEETPVAKALEEHPEWVSFLCHRIYDLSPLRLDRLQVPNTPIAKGLEEHVEWLLSQQPLTE
ncbi:MAG: NAD-dependent epimerase/dehydratase family protein [Armatimonadota bacterium]